MNFFCECGAVFRSTRGLADHQTPRNCEGVALNQLRRSVIELEEVAERLTATPCDRAPERCMEAETQRLKNLVGKRGATPVLYRDPARMCDECGALEHVQRALERLRNVVRS